MPFVHCWFWNHWVHIYKTSSSKCVQFNKYKHFFFSSSTNLILSSFISTLTGIKIILTWLLYPRPLKTKKQNSNRFPNKFLCFVNIAKKFVSMSQCIMLCFFSLFTKKIIFLFADENPQSPQQNPNRLPNNFLCFVDMAKKFVLIENSCFTFDLTIFHKKLTYSLWANAWLHWDQHHPPWSASWPGSRTSLGLGTYSSV